MIGTARFAVSVKAKTTGQGTSGQVATTSPPKTTRNVAKMTVVLMITAPTQYPGSRSNLSPQPEHVSFIWNQLEKAGSPHLGHDRFRARPTIVPRLAAGSRAVTGAGYRGWMREVASRLRQEYESEGLLEGDMADNPFDQFDLWMSGAMAAGVPEPNAFVLATADANGRPSARALLLKDICKDGLVFYTGMESPKSRDLETNPFGAATFVWLELHRQIRFVGELTKLDDDKADEYFASRPRGAQIAAHVAKQSTEVARREQLDSRFAQLQAEFGEDPIPRPGYWGGWRLVPDSVEFWQGQPDRFHDRVVYRPTVEGWARHRLAP